ncbi:MAG TPA: DUF6599 family protein [Bryobacteraceae bacterium]|nr:DUF6599 family protein [Bryobacteraceae bacterium]
MRLFVVAALLARLAAAQTLPDAIGGHPRTSFVKLARRAAEQPLWDELGLKYTDAALYASRPAPLTVSLFQLADSTAAMAAFYWQRPAASKPSTAAPLAAETPGSLLLVHGNYLLRFDGYKPSKPELEAFLGSLPNVDHSSLPARYLPDQGLEPNSERYITGPAGLQAFLPGIPASVVDFHMGAEGQSGVFHSPKGDVTLAVFSFPTPQIAMKELPGFAGAGLNVRRSMSLVAVTLPAAADPDFARMLLTGVRFEARVTVPEHIPTRWDNIGYLVINIFVLIGILLSITLVAGLAVGGFRAYRRRGGRDPDADTVIRLHLE